MTLRRSLISMLFSSALVVGTSAFAEFKLYVDTKTKQVFAEPGPGRIPMDFQPPAACAPTKHDAAAPSAGPSRVAISESASPDPKQPSPQHWYDNLSVRGYTQFRYTLLDDKDKELFHPADRTVGDNQTFLIRRGRLILSGDVNDHIFAYIQPEMFASPSDGDMSVQMRDLYSDIAIDKEKEYRVRVGQSKVPFGFVNLQSSQNRGPMERPDALNSAVEGERDIGVYFMWASTEIRERFRSLVKDGLKGSGDYGVVAVGAYNGQGLNRSDTNDEPHVVARASYPFKLDNGQFFEPGIQAYTGRYVPRVSALPVDGSEEDVEPSFDEEGVRDERIGVSAVLYPQPFGLEAEWNWGRGPTLDQASLTIDDEYLYGGYVQANYKIDSSAGAIFPFVRWQYFDGGRKFGRNAPKADINEWDFGCEYSPYPDVELATMYTYSNARTNSNKFPYEDVDGSSRVAMQVQVNY